MFDVNEKVSSTGFFEEQSGNEDSQGCTYFKWYNEDSRDERDATIVMQRRKIYNIEKSLILCKK